MFWCWGSIVQAGLFLATDSRLISNWQERWEFRSLSFRCLLEVFSHSFWPNFTHAWYWSSPVSSHSAPASSSGPRSSLPQNCWPRLRVSAKAAHFPSFLFLSTRSFWWLVPLDHSFGPQVLVLRRLVARFHTEKWMLSFGNFRVRAKETEISAFQSENRPLAVWWRSRSLWLNGKAVRAGDEAYLQTVRFWGKWCWCLEVYARCQDFTKSKSHAPSTFHSKVFSKINFPNLATSKTVHQSLISLVGMFKLD